MNKHLFNIFINGFNKHINDVNQQILELNKDSIDYSQQLEILSNQKNILEKKLESFLKQKNPRENKYSLENIYLHYGQYDSYVLIEFFSNSISAKKFGNEIYGNFHYSRLERLKLEDSIKEENISFTQGYVKFDSNFKNISEEQKTELKTEGFDTQDIYEINVLNIKENKTKKFDQKGIKDIPKTITLKIDKDYDFIKSTYWLLEKKLNDGFKLADFEFSKLIGFDLAYNSNNNELIKKFPEIKNFTSNSDIRFFELEAKCFYNRLTEDEIQEFNNLLIKRKKDRLKIIESEIKKNQNSTLQKFKKDSNNILVYKELEESLYFFDNEVLYHSKISIPIYWNFESYTHILMRHWYPIPKIKEKTSFQYNKKDIRRLLQIIIYENESDIISKLSNNQEFTRESYYYNGNYYKVHILGDGRVSTFYPRENPNQNS